MIKSSYLVSLLVLLWYFFLLLLPFLIIILIVLPLIKLKKYKVSLKEIIFYLFFYGLLPLIMPFFFFTFLFLFLFPIFNLLLDQIAIGMDFSKSIEKLGFVVLPLLVLMTLFFYLKITVKAIEKFKKIKIGLFVLIFATSVLLNLFIQYISCSISMLIPCDPSEYLTITGLLKTFVFYIICLASFILAIQYSNHFQRKPSKTS